MKTRVRETTLMLALVLLVPFGWALAEEHAAESERAERLEREEIERAERLEREEMEFEEAFLPEIPESLGEMIEIAMDRNPEIRKALAAVRQAEAELNQVRLEVTREVTAAGTRWITSRRQVRECERNGERAPFMVLRALAEGERELRYLLGLGSEMYEPEHFFEEHEEELLPPQARPKLSVDYKDRLESPVAMDFSQGPTQLSEILEFLSDYLDVNFIQDIEMPDPEMRFEIGEQVPLRNGLLAMADQCEYLCFVMRDFGVLATSRERAERMNAPCIPDDVPLRLTGPRPPQPRPEVDSAAGIGEALSSPVSLDFGQAQTHLVEIFDFISEYLDINITVHRDVADLTTSPRLEDVPLRAALRSLCDQCEPLCFVIRDYGILATTREHAEGIVAPTIPEDVPLHVPLGMAYEEKARESEAEETE